METRLGWAGVRGNWDGSWRRKVFYAETTVRRAAGNVEGDPRYPAPGFTDTRFDVGFCAGIAYGAHSALFPIPQRGPEERTGSRDLGMRSDRFLSPGLATFVRSLPAPIGEYEMVDDGHRAQPSRGFRESLGIARMHWPPASPDLKPVEDVWDQLGRRIRRRERQAEHPARNREELVAIAQEEWEGIDWGRVDKSIAGMGGKIAAVIKRKGGYTK